MMNDLEMPLALPGLQIDADETLTEQVVAMSMAAVKVRRRGLNRQIHEAEFFVDRHLSPDAGVAISRPRIVEPGVIPKLAGLGNRVERPELFARSHIKRPHLALRVVVRRYRHAFFHR